MAEKNFDGFSMAKGSFRDFDSCLEMFVLRRRRRNFLGNDFVLERLFPIDWRRWMTDWLLLVSAENERSLKKDYPSKFFSALQSYCPRLSVVLLSSDIRSTLIRLDPRKNLVG